MGLCKKWGEMKMGITGKEFDALVLDFFFFLKKKGQTWYVSRHWHSYCSSMPECPVSLL